MEKERCPTTFPGYKSFIVTIPWKTLKYGNDLGTWDKIKTFISKGWQHLLLKPDCIGVEGEFREVVYYMPNQFSGDPKKLNEANLKLCYKLSRGDVAMHLEEQAGTSNCPGM